MYENGNHPTQVVKDGRSSGYLAFCRDCKWIHTFPAEGIAYLEATRHSIWKGEEKLFNPKNEED